MRPAGAGERWAPPIRANRPWRSALAVALLLHGVTIALALLLVSGLVPPAPPDSTPVEMVFLAPGTSEQPAAQSRPTAAEVPAPPPEAEPSPQAGSPQEPATPQLPETPQPEPQPAPAQPAPPETHQPEPRPSPAPAPQPKPHPPQLRRPPARSKSPPPETATTAPPTAASSPQSPAAPAEAAPAPAPASTSAGWRQALAAWLAQHKSYPEEARRRGDEGTVVVRFGLDRSGRVIDVNVLRGSRSSILDAATVAMLRNAVLPPPPAMSADRITISVQVHYALTD